MYLSLTFLFLISFSFEKAGRVSSLSNSRHISREHILNTRKLWSRDSADQEVHIIGNMGTVSVMAKTGKEYMNMSLQNL